MADRTVLIERLRALEEDLRDLAYATLRDARDARALADERRVQKARRSVARAIAHLEGAPGEDDAPDGT